MAAWLARSRYLVLIAVVGIFLSALATYGWALATTIDFIVEMLTSDAWEESGTIVELLEVLDLYLIGTVLLITAIGLYELFIGTVQLPE